MHSFYVFYPSQITLPGPQTYVHDVLQYRLVCRLDGVQKQCVIDESKKFIKITDKFARAVGDVVHFYLTTIDPYNFPQEEGK